MTPFIVVHVIARPKPGLRAELERTLDDVLSEARSLPGCRRYEWFHFPRRAPDVFVCAEFESEEAFADYRRGKVVARIGREILPLLDGRPVFRHFRATVIEEG